MKAPPPAASPDTARPPATAAQYLGWLVYKILGLIFSVAWGSKQLVSHILWRRKKFSPTAAQRESLLADPLPDLVHQFVEVDGIKLHMVRTCTNPGGAKPLLLLLHGFPETWFSWRHQMEALRGEWCVVAIDLLGYGGSDKPQDVASYHMHRLVGNVVGAIRILDPPGGRVTLVGHDAGGVLAWHLAHMQPQLVDRLVVMCAPHPVCWLANVDWDQMKRSWYIFAFQFPWIPEAVLCAGGCDFIGEMLNGPVIGCKNPQALTQRDVDRFKLEFGLPGVATAALNYYKAAVEYTTIAESPEVARALGNKIQAPTLVIWADKDVALGLQLLRGLEKHVERLRVHTLQDCSHWAQQDRWMEVNELLKEFLGAASSLPAK